MGRLGVRPEKKWDPRQGQLSKNISVILVSRNLKLAFFNWAEPAWLISVTFLALWLWSEIMVGGQSTIKLLKLTYRRFTNLRKARGFPNNCDFIDHLLDRKDGRKCFIRDVLFPLRSQVDRLRCACIIPLSIARPFRRTTGECLLCLLRKLAWRLIIKIPVVIQASPLDRMGFSLPFHLCSFLLFYKISKFTRKRREWLHQSAQQRRSSSIHLGRTVLTSLNEQQTVEQQAVEFTTFRPEASSGKRNER